MLKAYKIIIFMSIILVAVFSCDEGMWTFNVDCENNCSLYKPDSANLIVHITIDDENPYVPLVFYRGDIEENILEWIDTSYSDRLELFSPVDEYYSVKAFYKNGEETIIAVDGSKMKAVYVSDVCSDESGEVTVDCWTIKGGILDVRLKK